MHKKYPNRKHSITPQMLQIARKTVMHKTENRLRQRTNEIVSIINGVARRNSKFAPLWRDFTIHKLDEIIHSCLEVLRTWDGGRYDKPINTNKKSFNKTRDFWCREKYKPIGSKLIHPIFCQLYKYIFAFNVSDISDSDKVLLYIDIKLELLAKKIKFTRTSAKPVILYSTFFKPNKWKEQCKAFLKCFNFGEEIEWGSVKVTKSVKRKNERKAKSQYIRDPNRALVLHDTFVKHLKDIKLQIIEYVKSGNVERIQSAMSGFMGWIERRLNGNGMTSSGEITENNAENTGAVVESTNNANRPFQSPDYADIHNRIHRNIMPVNTHRNELREAHIRRMRTQTQILNTPYSYAPYQYFPTTVYPYCAPIQYAQMQQIPPCIPIVPVQQRQYSYSHIPPIPLIPPMPIPQIPQMRQMIDLPPIVSIGWDNNDATVSPMTNGSNTLFTATPPQNEEKQPTAAEMVILPETINGSNDNRERHASFRDYEDNSLGIGDGDNCDLFTMNSVFFDSEFGMEDFGLEIDSQFI